MPAATQFNIAILNIILNWPATRSTGKFYSRAHKFRSLFLSLSILLKFLAHSLSMCDIPCNISNWPIGFAILSVFVVSM